jgi:hypothetical protein
MGRYGKQANIPSNIVHTILTPTTRWCSVHGDLARKCKPHPDGLADGASGIVLACFFVLSPVLEILRAN